MPQDQKTKTENRNNILANSVKDFFKNDPRQKKKNFLRSKSFVRKIKDSEFLKF